MLPFDRPEIKAAATPALLQRGCVHVIGLEPIREQAGARWEKIRDGVYLRLEAILRQKLSPADFFAPLNDTAYLVTMPTTDAETAEVGCLRIAHELYTSYLGRFDLGKLSISRATQSGKDLVALEPCSKERVDLLAERAGLVQPGTAAAQGTAARHDEAFAPQFMPMWDAHKEAITSYLCSPRKIGVWESLAQADLTPRERATIELSSFSQGIAILARHVQMGERFLMAFRLSFETLASVFGRTEFVSACRDAPAALRQFIVFELAEVPAGATHGRLSDLMMMLRPFSKAILAQVPIGSRSYAAYEGIGLQAVGINVRRTKLATNEINDEIVKLCTSAKRIALTTFLNGVSDLPTLRAARDARVHFMTGRMIAPFLLEPGPMRRLSWREVVETAARVDQAN